MKIIFSTENGIHNCLLVSGFLSDCADTGIIGAVKTGSRTQIKCAIARWKDGEHGEEEILRQSVRNAVGYALKNGFKDLVFEAESFVENNADIPYVTNILTEELYETDADGIATILLAEYKGEELLNELNKELDKPVSETVNQAYGQFGDPLRDEFEEFQKSLSEEKPLRQYLVDLMDQKGIRKSSDVYKAAGVSKFTFSKIINFSKNPPYKPSRDTVAALSVGLKLNLEETQKFYAVAGFHLGLTEFTDRVIRFFIGKGIYSLYDINYCMIEHGYPPLGERPRGEKPVVKHK